MVDLGNFSTKYTQGAGQEIKIIDNKAMLRAPYCLQSCPVFFICLSIDLFICLCFSFQMKIHLDSRQWQTRTLVAGTIWLEIGEWAAQSALLGGIVQGCQDQDGWELEHGGEMGGEQLTRCSLSIP